jgi:XTP/dITP diphosphohydrolase
MKKITEIIIGTNNEGKYREICALLPKDIKKYSPKEFDILEPEENGTSFEENSLIKASYFSKKTNLICLSDDSGLEVDLLNGAPGIYSARWGGIKKDFDLAIQKVIEEMKNVEKNWINKSEAQFICSLSLFFPGGKNYSSKGIVKGKISANKKGDKGFGYDPIFIPEGFTKTFGEMDPKLKMSIDHRYKAYLKIKNFFTSTL